MGQRMSRVTVLAHLDRLSVYYALEPLLVHAGADVAFDVTTSLEHCLHEDTNRNLLVVRYFSTYPAGSAEDRRLDPEVLARLRERYDRVTFFDDSAGAGTTRFEVLPYVDWYLKKQVLRDRSLYTRQLYGRQLFTDHYHREHGVTDTVTLERDAVNHEAQLTKVQVAYNSGMGSFPVHRFRQRLGVALARTVGVGPALWLRSAPRPAPVGRSRPLGVHAHFRAGGPATVRHQRELLARVVDDDPLFLTGPVSPRRFRRELLMARGALSPFGWGEICLRDFEAVLAGSLLLKPRMDHLETWPDIYVPYETYVPLAWDGRDVHDQALRYSQGDPADRRRIAEQAQQVLFDARRQLPDRVERLLQLMVA